MTSSKTEEWRDIPGYEGRYQASSLGRIRSLDRRVNICRGATRLMKGRVLKAAGSKYNPHLTVVLGHGCNGSLVHRLIASAFLGPCPEGQEVRHLDGNPLNNHIANLAYGTRTENILDVLRIGKTWRGSVTINQAREIRKKLENGTAVAIIAKELNVSPASVYRIKEGRTFRWLK